MPLLPIQCVTEDFVIGETSLIETWNWSEEDVQGEAEKGKEGLVMDQVLAVEDAANW